MDKGNKDEVSEELFTERGRTTTGECQDAKAIVARLAICHEELQEFPRIALKLAGADPHEVQLPARPRVCPLRNQTILEAIWVWDEERRRHHGRQAGDDV